MHLKRLNRYTEQKQFTNCSLNPDFTEQKKIQNKTLRKVNYVLIISINQFDNSNTTDKFRLEEWGRQSGVLLGV